MARRVPADRVRNASDELAIKEGCWYDAERAERPIEFMRRFCRQSKGRWAGKPLELLDWQKDIVRSVYGWYRPDGLRRFRRVYVEVPKKNGKSTMLSGLGLYGLMADREPAAEVYINACDRAQASIIFDEAERMVRASADLTRRLDIIASRKRIAFPGMNGVLVANSAQAPSKDGFSPSLTVFDELHRQRGRALYEVFEYASSAREQPLWFDITTAGEVLAGLWHEQREYADKVNAGQILDTSFYGKVYRAMPDDDLDDPAVWHKANPSLGTTLSLEDFRNAHAKARANPTLWPNFARLRLGVVVSSLTRLISDEAWNACLDASPIEDGRPVYVGLDLSSKIDLSSLTAYFPREDVGADVRSWSWTPRDTISERERVDGVSYRAWAEAGWLFYSEGARIDYAQIAEAVRELDRRFDLRCVAADPWYAPQMLQTFQESDGFNVLSVRQGYQSQTGPIKEIMAQVAAREIFHDGNPLLASAVRNAVAKRDENDNIRIMKNKSTGRIDPLAAMVSSVAGYLSSNEDDSTYEDEGLFVL